MIRQGGIFSQAEKIILILLLIGAGFFCFGKSCWAADINNIIINEVMPFPTQSDNYNEWIEIYNSGSKDVDLSNYTLCGKILITGYIDHEDGQIKAASEMILSVGKYAVITDGGSGTEVYSNFQVNSNALALHVNASSLCGGLTNSGKNITLEVDSSVYDFIYSNAENGKSFSLIDGDIQITNPTPGAANQVAEHEPEPEPEPEEGSEDEEKDEQQKQEEQKSSDAEAMEGEEEAAETQGSGIAITANKLGDIVINEFVSDPADEEVEWIELYNMTNKEINLTDWVIEEGSGAKTKLEGIIGASNESKFFIIEKPKGNLNNKGDIIVLRDSTGILIDQVAYGNWDDGNIENNAPVTGDPYSVARKFDGQNSFNNANDFAVTTTLTKGASNIIIKTEESSYAEASEDKGNYDYSDDIVISEIFPNPFGSDSENEFIELYNMGGRDVDLLGWRVGDESKKRYEFKYANDAKERQETLIIKVGEYLIIYRSESKIALNNGGDSVKLYQPLKDEPCQIVKYEKSIEGWSYNISDLRFKILDLRSDNYIWSETVTPGATNEIKTINHSPVVDFDCPEEIMIGVPVLFDSSDTVDEDGDELKFSWDFGDGFTNKLDSPEHTFFQQGAYTVKLTVSDGENEVEKEKIVKVVSALNVDGANNNGIAMPLIEGDPALREGRGRLQSTARNDNIVINEFLPNPEGADAEGEFIELYNQGAGDVNLIDWKVDDSEGGSKPYIFDFDLWLDSGMYYALDREESGLALNNTTDAVRLFDNFNELIEEIEYEAVVEGEAYARGKNGKWFWTTVITPGEENVISVADSSASKVIVKSASYDKNAKKVKQIVEITLEKISECEVGDLVKVAGIVAVKPGILGSQYFYIVAPSPNPSPATSLRERGAKEIKIASVDFIPSGTSQTEDNINASESLSGDSDGAEKISKQAAGIQVYNYKKDFPNLKVGDYIEVSGELSMSSGELRLKTKAQDDFKILEHREPPIASEATCEKVNEEYVGQLITVTGEIVERKSSIVYLDDGTDEVIVYIKTATGIKPKSIKEGEIVAVTGLVGRTKSGIRIMPRSSNDIIKKDPQSHSAVGRVLGEVAVSDVWEIAQRDKKIELFQYLLILAGGVIVVLGGLLIKEVRRV